MSKKLKQLPDLYIQAIEQIMHDLFPPILNIEWIGAGSVAVTFVDPPAHMVGVERWFDPFILNWTFTRLDRQQRVRLNIPVALRDDVMQEAQRDQ